ncbi:DMT family transporter [Roseovarius sp. C7]|uniref:DMT family transporter n=1 Tax=Roseovarius sp. C7 TaxID=3398643 RepID=UPI0039F6755D
MAQSSSHGVQSQAAQSQGAHLAGVAAVLIAAILWGTTGTAATFAPEVSPVAIGAAAMGFGGLLQALVALGGISRHRAAIRRNWRCLWLGAVAVALYPLAFYASMRLAGVTIGTLVSLGSAPLLSALIENRLDGLRLDRRWMVGAGIGLVGMALLSLAETGGHGVGGSHPLAGALLGLGAGLTYALYSWTARRMMQRGISARATMGATFGLGGLLLMPVLALTGAAFLDSWGNAGVGIYMAVVPMFLGYLAFGYGLARVAASLATTLTLFEPVVAALLAVAVVGERLDPVGWAGVALVVLCLLWLTLPVRDRASMAKEPI